MKVLVVGGTRFFGIPMIKSLLANGHDVTVATRGNAKVDFDGNIDYITLDSTNINYFSGYAKVSFDGFINENNFELNPREKNLVENLEIYHGIAKNPLSFNKDIFLGFLVKSKYDGIGNRKPIDLSIALDVSGSMSSIDNSSIGKSRLTLAKEGLKKLVSILDEKNDRVSLLTFNHEIQKLFTLINKKDIETKFLNDIDAIKANGGTDLLGQ